MVNLQKNKLHRSILCKIFRRNYGYHVFAANFFGISDILTCLSAYLFQKNQINRQTSVSLKLNGSFKGKGDRILLSPTVGFVHELCHGRWRLTIYGSILGKPYKFRKKGDGGTTRSKCWHRTVSNGQTTSICVFCPLFP